MKAEYKELFNAITPDSELLGNMNGHTIKAHHTARTAKAAAKTMLAVILAASLTVVSFAGIAAPEFLVSVLGGKQEKVNELFYGEEITFDGSGEFRFVYKGMLANAFTSYIMYEIHSPASYTFLSDECVEYYDDMNVEIKPFGIGAGGYSGGLKYRDEHTLDGIIIWNGTAPLLGMKAQLSATKIGVLKKTFDDAGENLAGVEREVLAEGNWNAEADFRCSNAHMKYDVNAEMIKNNSVIKLNSVRVTPIDITINADYSGSRFTLRETKGEIAYLALTAKYNDGTVVDCGTLSFAESYNEKTGEGEIKFTALPADILEYTEICELTVSDAQNTVLAVITLK